MYGRFRLVETPVNKNNYLIGQFFNYENKCILVELTFTALIRAANPDNCDIFIKYINRSII